MKKNILELKKLILKYEISDFEMGVSVERYNLACDDVKKDDLYKLNKLRQIYYSDIVLYIEKMKNYE